jgi:integrase
VELGVEVQVGHRQPGVFWHRFDVAPTRAAEHGPSPTDSAPGCAARGAVVVEPKDRPLYFGPPKSAAGRRVVTIPNPIIADLRAHFDSYASTDADALIFTSEPGSVLRRSNFQQATQWTATVAAIGLPGFHFHDLRRTGNTLAADSGASLRVLMTRMGRSSTGWR